MPVVRFISRRFFRGRRNDRFLSRITFIAVVGIMLGTASLIITLSILGGFEREITEKVIGFTSHVQIRGFQYQPLPDPSETEKLLEDSVGLIRTVAPYAAREAILRSPEGADGIFLKGVPAGGTMFNARKYLVEGSYDLQRPEGGLPRLILGRKLASRLSLRIGDKAAVFGLAGSVSRGNVTVGQFIVSGLFESGMAEYDDIMAFTDLPDAQQFLRLDNAVTGYDVMVSDLDSAQAVSDRIDRLLGYPHYSRTVFESYRNIFSWIELQDLPTKLVLGLIILVATVNIIGTLLMMVLSKTRNVGILLSLGMTRSSVSKIFLRQGMMIAVTGTFLGNLFGFAVCFIQYEFKILSLPAEVYFMSAVPILLRWEDFLLVTLVSLTLSVISSYIPSRFASRVDPVRAIRFS